MIRSVEFDFTAQQDAQPHFTIPIDARRALGLGADGPVFLEIWTRTGHARGVFEMTSNGEVRSSSQMEGPNRLLIGVVEPSGWGFARASRPDR